MYIKQKHMTNNNTNEQKPTTNNSASNTRQNPTTNERGTMVHTMFTFSAPSPNQARIRTIELFSPRPRRAQCAQALRAGECAQPVACLQP